MNQLYFFIKDYKRFVGKYRYRYLYGWCNLGVLGILMYRIERQLYLWFGKFYLIFRVLVLPILVFFKGLTNIDIHYKANIKGGILILHNAIGVVISGKVVIGENLTLTGGNVIGVSSKEGNYSIGNSCNLGANATIIGPLKLADKIKIGASACVTKTFENNNLTLVGVPAKELV